MCKCNSKNRTPFCGKGDCVPENKKKIQIQVQTWIRIDDALNMVQEVLTGRIEDEETAMSLYESIRNRMYFRDD